MRACLQFDKLVYWIVKDEMWTIPQRYLKDEHPNKGTKVENIIKVLYILRITTKKFGYEKHTFICSNLKTNTIIWTLLDWRLIGYYLEDLATTVARRIWPCPTTIKPSFRIWPCPLKVFSDCSWEELTQMKLQDLFPPKGSVSNSLIQIWNIPLNHCKSNPKFDKVC